MSIIPNEMFRLFPLRSKFVRASISGMGCDVLLAMMPVICYKLCAHIDTHTHTNKDSHRNVNYMYAEQPMIANALKLIIIRVEIGILIIE